MKTIRKKRHWSLPSALLLYLIVSNPALAWAQNNAFADQLKHIQNIAFPAEVRQFYQRHGFTPAWINEPAKLTAIDALLKECHNLGLYAQDYQFTRKPLTTSDSIITDIYITAALIRFYKNINSAPLITAVSYDGLPPDKRTDSIALKLAAASLPSQLNELIHELEPQNEQYAVLKKIIPLLDSTPSIEMMVQRSLRIRGSARQEQWRSLSDAMNTIRWLQKYRDAYAMVIVVNIPSATLTVFSNDTILLRSNVVVGKASTPTPTLGSDIKQVVLYPYWTVPYKIAVNELLPVIKVNRKYLDANFFKVYDLRGNKINPENINWQKLNASNFPYILRQSSGCDNALGVIKFDFDSPFGVYLHDTPAKPLFKLGRRYLSHGCVRVEKAQELAKLILKNNVAIDFLKTEAAMGKEVQQFIHVQEKIPVFIVYNTAWFNQDGKFDFYEDIYHYYK